ncbi:MAG: 4-fold beta flower protein [Ignavibacteriaceae bacterium]
MKKLIIIIFLVIGYTVYAQNENTIFNSNGEATHYIENTTNTIYSFDGSPVAFLSWNSSSGYNIYTFKGQHLGWFNNEIIRDHDGNIIGFEKGAVNTFTKLEPMKGMKKALPMKPMEALAPAKPLFFDRFSKNSIVAFFYGAYNKADISTDRSVPTLYNTTNTEFVSTPLYHPPFAAIEQTLALKQEVYNKQQGQINELLKKGYVYDAETNSYFAPDKWPSVKEARKYLIKYVIDAFEKTTIYLQRKPIKNGKYLAYFITNTNPNPIIYSGMVEVQNQKLRSMEYSGRKRRFKNASKIQNGMCSAKTFDKFGFTQNSIVYPESQFYIFEINKVK